MLWMGLNSHPYTSAHANIANSPWCAVDMANRYYVQFLRISNGAEIMVSTGEFKISFNYLQHA